MNGQNRVFQKNDIVTVTIEDIGNDGEGIGRADGYTLFVKDAVIGDTVEARITKCKKNYGYARVEKVAAPSPFRVEPRCAYYRQCGGCQLQAMRYDRQLLYKQQKVRDSLLRIGGFSAETVDRIMEPIVGMEDPWHYRNKAQYPVGMNRQGDIVTGFYAGRTHDIIANTDCALGAEENKEILERILTYMRRYHVPAYDEHTGSGLVRHVLIRTAFSTGEIMVCLVINGKRLPAEDRLTETLRGMQTGKRRVAGISVSVNEERTNVIMGKEIRVLWGSTRIEDTMRLLTVQDGSAGFAETGRQITFRISPLSFYQVNPRQTEKLYSIALDYAALTGHETVWDLYCGIGTISLCMAQKARQVYGVEVIPQAIDDARENAERNGIRNVKFLVGKAEEVLPAFYGSAERGAGEAAKESAGTDSKAVSPMAADRTDFAELAPEMKHPDVIVVDPPRKGCDGKCLETMLAMQPDRIVYVSCDPATLARDLKVLAAGGYELKRARAVDQFGMTVHTETVCLLSKLNVKQHIEVELNLDEMDLTAAEK